jgi:hypothetical protein
MKLERSLLKTAAMWPLLAAASFLILLPSCGDGSAEEAGEEVDEAVEDVKDRVDD